MNIHLGQSSGNSAVATILLLAIATHLLGVPFLSHEHHDDHDKHETHYAYHESNHHYSTRHYEYSLEHKGEKHDDHGHPDHTEEENEFDILSLQKNKAHSTYGLHRCVSHEVKQLATNLELKRG